MRLKTLLLGAALAVVSVVGITSAAHATQWKALAMNERGDWYGAVHDDEGNYFFNEQAAREWAAYFCESEWARTCYVLKSVPVDWTLSGIMCDGYPSAGGSKYGRSGADQMAIKNAGGCRRWYNIGHF